MHWGSGARPCQLAGTGIHNTRGKVSGLSAAVAWQGMCRGHQTATPLRTITPVPHGWARGSIHTTDTLGSSLPGLSHRKQTQNTRTLCPRVPQARTHTPRHAEDTRYRYPQAASERPLSGAHSHSCNTRLRRTTLSALGGAARVARRRSHSRRPLWGPHEAAKSPQRDQLSRGSLLPQLGSNQTHLRQPLPWRVRPKCESAPVTHHRLQGVRPALGCLLLKLRDEQSDSPASSTRASNSSCQAQLWPPAPSAFPRGTYGPPARAQRGCRLP